MFYLYVGRYIVALLDHPHSSDPVSPNSATINTVSDTTSPTATVTQTITAANTSPRIVSSKENQNRHRNTLSTTTTTTARVSEVSEGSVPRSRRRLKASPLPDTLDADDDELSFGHYSDQILDVLAR